MELDSVTFSNNQKYLGWLIGRRIHQPRQDSNLFQNPKETGTYTWNNPPQPTPVDFSNTNINGQTIYLYVVPKKALSGMGDSLRMDNVHVREMMSTRNGGLLTLKYIDVNDDTLLPFYKLQLAYDPYNNIPIPQTQLDRQLSYSKLTDTLFYVPNTLDTLFPAYTYHLALNSSDPIVQQCQARDDQYINFYFVSSTGYPGNSVSAKYTPDGKVRASVGK